jgi:hypothetical protein
MFANKNKKCDLRIILLKDLSFIHMIKFIIAAVVRNNAAAQPIPINAQIIRFY